MNARRKPISAAAVTVAFVMVLSACTSPSDDGDDGGTGIKEGGILRIGTSSGLISPNPFVGFNQDDYATWMQIYPSLLQYDTTTPTYDYMPGFASEWEQSADGLTLTFKTIPDATWSDGEPLTAEDAAWTFNMIKKYPGPTGTWSGTVQFMKSVKAPDPNTLVVTYSRPTGTGLFDVGFTPILPPQVWEQYATGDGEGIATFANEPEGGEPLVGGGPFIMTEYRKNDIALFEKNPNYYGTKPHIDGFGLQFFRDEDAMVTALKTDQLDAISEVPPTSVETLESAGMEVYQGPALALRDFIFNLNPDKSQHKELLDPKVREAMEYAIDRDAIVQTAWVGRAAPGASIVPAGNATGGVSWNNPDVEPLPFDVAAANQILDSLGYERGDDGIRIADGHPMDYEVIFPLDEEGAGDRAFQIIQQGFREIGIELTQKKLDNNAAWEAMYCGPDCEYRDFDLAMWDWFPAADPDFILGVLTCDQWGDWSDTAYCNPEYDKLYERQKTTVDPQARQDIVFEMQQIAYDDRPYVILTYDQRLDAWSPKWTGLVESVQGIYNNFSTQSLTSVHMT
jgi:peptide/nickel transport system substrate-binding protein